MQAARRTGSLCVTRAHHAPYCEKNDCMTPMRLLNLSLSTPMADQPADQGPNDPQLHQIAYSRFFEKMIYVIKTPDYPKYKPFDLTEKIRIIPSCSANRWAFMRDAMRLGAQAVREQGANIIAAQEPFGTGVAGLLLSRRFNLPLCVHNVNDAIDNKRWLAEEPVNRLMNPVGKYVLRRAGAVRVDSVSETEKMVRLGLPRKRVWNIQFIVNDAAAFMDCDGSDMRKNLLVEPFNQYILFVGRFEPQKDFETLFGVVKHVAAQRPHVRFVVVGSGKRDAEYRAMAQAAGVHQNILFAGWVDYFQLPQYYAGADAFLLTSVHETNPRVVIFSRLARKAAVATDVSGVRDFIQDGVSGFVRPLKDVPGLAQALISILDDPEKAAEMGCAGFENARHILDESQILNQMESMYRSIFDERFGKA